MDEKYLGKVVSKAVLQKKWLVFLTVELPRILGIIAVIFAIAMGNLIQDSRCVDWSNYSYRCLDYETYFGWGPFFIALIIWAVIIGVYYLMVKIYTKQEIVVTDIGVTGKLKVFFSLMEITIPIDQVSSIAIAKGLFNSKFMIIASASGRHHIAYIENPEEIRDAILKVRQN